MTYSNFYPQKDKRIVQVTRGTEVPNLLYDLLTCPSPHGMEGHIYNMLPCKDRGYRDAKGNFIVKIGENPKILYSCHMDTVHTVKEEYMKKNIRVRLWLVTMNGEADEKDAGFIWAGIKQDPNKNKGEIKFEPMILGADDKLGCYIMCEMIDHEIPGLYIFHVGEERGGLGSKWIVDNTPKLLEGIQHAVAFDRMNYHDIICHQQNRRCASIAFADELAARLNKQIGTPAKFKGDVHGTFTDTASYMDIIPECTNLSVGYFNQHTDRESFDIWWLETKLLPAILQLNWDDLPVIRDPKAKPVTHTYHYSHNQQDWTPLKPSEVEKSTPWAKIPKWHPKQGLLLDASHDGMIEIAKKAFGMAQSQELAEWAIPYMEAHELLVDEFDELMIKHSDLIMMFKKLQNKQELTPTELEALEEILPNDEPKEEVKTALEEIAKAVPLLPSPSTESTKSIIIINEKLDRDMYPANIDEYRARVARKMAIITGVIENKQTLNLEGQIGMTFVRQTAKFNGIVANIRKSREGLKVSKKVYSLLGDILCHMVEIIEQVNNENKLNGGIMQAYQEGVKYINTYYYEPGITPMTRA